VPIAISIPPVRFPAADDNVLGPALVDGAFDPATREGLGDSRKIFFTLPNAVFDHGIDETGFFGGDLSGQFRNIDDC